MTRRDPLAPEMDAVSGDAVFRTAHSLGAGIAAGPGKREVDLYVRTYTTLLQSSGAIGVSSLEPAHLTAAPSLHAGAAEPKPDMNALAYSSLRLPACILDVKHIVLGQSAHRAHRAGDENGSMTAKRRWRPTSPRHRISTI
jgi:hypothetical protein